MRNLRSWTVLSTIGLALSIGACGDDDDGATTGTPTTNDTVTASDTGEPTTGEPTTGEPTTGEPTTGEPTTGEDETTGDVPEICVVQDDDSECTICTKENCCDELAACGANEVCLCLVQCIAASDLSTDEALAFCQEPEQCDIGSEEGQNMFPTEALPLQTCNGANCAVECG